MPQISVLLATCLQGRVPIDPLPSYYSLPNPVLFASLGDWIYHDGTDDRNSFSCDAVEFPRGSGLVLTLPAPVGGVMPTGAVTVTNGGTGHPINRSALFIYWVKDATTGADTAWGYLTTNGSGVVTAATLQYGGRPGDYTHSGTRAFTEDTDLWTWAHPDSWAYRSRRVVTATTPMRKFMALPMKRILAPDDHEAWNGGFPGAFGSKCPPTVTTQAQSYAFWQTASAGVRMLLDQDFNNPAWTSPVTPYVPNGLTGLGLTGTEPFFKVRYFYIDITLAGDVVIAPCGANSAPPAGTFARLIVLDCLFEKDNYQIGSDDINRNLISPTQEAWLDAVQATATAAGVRSIGILSSKDRHGQNSDGWYTHQTQFARIAANIQAKGYPTWLMTGDRHVPHAARWRVARGDPADLHMVCATALGATSDAITPYPQMDWADQSPDVPVLGSVVFDTDAGTTTLSVHDMGTGRAKYAIRIPFGSRTASEANTYMAAARVSPPVPVPDAVPARLTTAQSAAKRAAGVLGIPAAVLTDTQVAQTQALVSGGANSALVAGRMTALPTASRRTLMQSCMEALFTAGVWKKLDGLYMFAAHDEQAGRLNWIGAGAQNAINTNGCTFTPNSGFAGDGSTSYLDSGLAASSAENYSLNSAFAAVWVISAVSGDTAHDFSCGGGTYLNSRAVNGNAIVRCNNNVASASSAAVASSAGLLAVSRLSSDAFTIYKDAAVLSRPQVASVSVSASPFYVGRNASNYSARRIAMAAFGAGLSDSEYAAFYAAVSTYLAAIGAI